MRPKLIALTMLALASSTFAYADPTGSFEVRGNNGDDASTYTGTVHVTRTGKSYKVDWDIASEKYSGTGLGIRLIDGKIVTGPASADDIGISVAFESDGTPGVATYFEQSDGDWKGSWSYAGWENVASEDWIPKNRTTVVKVEKKDDTKIRSMDGQNSKSAPMPTTAGPKN